MASLWRVLRFEAGRRKNRAWLGIMKNMNRAALLVPFLAISLMVAQAQDMPAGKGKDLVENTCGSCHGLDVVVSQHATHDGWASIVDYMVSRGATGTPAEIATIVDYLAKNFPAAATKTNVNKASSMDLQTQLELTPKDADAIVAYRTAHGDFKDFDGLAKVPGVDSAKLTAKKDSIAFSDAAADSK
jgi:competence ComEA-like helix-hairpin-helix protein